jgi:hypothetical protein
MIPEKMCLQPCRFRGGFNRDWREYGERSGSNPTRIFNSDKSSFHFCPKTGKILKCKGEKSAYEIDRGLATASTTDMLTFSASGMMCPPILMYPCKRIPSEITKRVPDDRGVGHSLVGWMTAKVFYEYIGYDFVSHLGKHNAKFPANLSVGGHCTHITYQLSELCSELVITLLCIHPNAKGLLQQLDVATFRPLSLGWKMSVLEWHRQNSDKILNKEWFAPVLDGALKKYSVECSAILRFRTCGLYLWDPDNTNF